VPGTKHLAWHILTGKYERPDESNEDVLQRWDDVNSVAKLTMEKIVSRSEGKDRKLPECKGGLQGAQNGVRREVHN